MNSTQTVRRGRNTSQPFSSGQHYSDTKSRQRYYKGRAQQTNIPHEHNHRNPQQYITKSNAATYKGITGFIPGMYDQFNMQ